MSDDRLRKLERRWKATGAAEDEGAYLVERMRLGLLEPAIDLAHQAALAKAIDAASAEDVRVEIDPTAPDFQLEEDVRRVLAEDLAQLDATGLARAFPRDDDGRLTLEETVLLAPYPCGQRLSRGRTVWLAACSPAKRRDDQVVSVRLVAVLPDNHAHRWDTARHLWDRGAPRPADESDPATLALLRVGRFAEALARHDVALSASVQRILGRRESDRWRVMLRRVLSECAPWAMARVSERTRLVALPGQTQLRKTSLVLGPKETGPGALLEVEDTGSNVRLPEVLWKRQLADDLGRQTLLVRPPTRAPVGLAAVAPAAERAAEVFRLLDEGPGRWTKADALARRLGPSTLTPGAIAALGNPARRLAILSLVQSVRIPVPLATLMMCLDDEDPLVRGAVVDALASSDAPEAERLAAVRRTVADEAASVREKTLRALVELGGSDEELVDLLGDRSEAVRLQAIRAVEARRIATAVPRLLRMARGTGEVGNRAIEALGTLRAREAVPLLVDAVAAADPRRDGWRLAAICTAIRRIGAADAAPPLEALLAKGLRPNIRPVVEQAVATLRRSTPRKAPKKR